MEASDIIGCILGIPVLYIIYKIFTKGFAYYLSFLAKIFNRHIILNGQDGPDPNTLNELWTKDKEKLAKLKNIAMNVGQKIKNIRGTENANSTNDINFIYHDKTTDKITKIQKLVELKNLGALTDSEFNFLKSEILNSK